ncbi:MAG: hypothetical protein U0Q16_00350 [Bryobacteraceae bacterium]
MVRGGYGIYYDTSIYQPIAQEMSQQAPLSKSLRIANTAQTPLTLANGFNATGAVSSATFGVDPAFEPVTRKPGSFPFKAICRARCSGTPPTWARRARAANNNSCRIRFRADP